MKVISEATVQLKGERMAVPAVCELNVTLPPAMATPQMPSLLLLPLASNPLLELLAMNYSCLLACLIEEPIITRCLTCTRRPMHHVHDLMSGKGVTAVTDNNNANEAEGVSFKCTGTCSLSLPLLCHMLSDPLCLCCCYLIE